ncbi:MAG: type II/IV secretion system protein, partial [Desulfobulbaceae bacterium]
MKLLNSEALLDLLMRQRLLTADQRQFVMLEKGKQRQKLLRQFGKEGGVDKNYPDLVEIIVSFNLFAGGNEAAPLDEETIMLAVARDQEMPFKKLDPLELDMEIVTKKIPRNFAIRQLILPFNIQDGFLEVAVYHPDCQAVLADIEQVVQMRVRPYITTKSDIKRILAEFFGFQRSISAAEDQFGVAAASGSVDIGNLERYVKIASSKEITPSDQHIKQAV